MTETRIEPNPTTVHPAIDFTAEHAYVGQKIHDNNSRRGFLTIVSDNRDWLYFHDVTTKVRNVYLKYVDFNMEQRWSKTGIENFVHGADPVERTKLFSRIKALFMAYIELPDKRLYDLLTLWSIGTYFYWLFNAYPYIYVGGISGSGKTKLLTLCSSICFNSVSTSDASSSCLFRLIQSTRCSIFVDESEALSNPYTSSDLRALLLSGYKKGLRVYRNRRTTEGNFEPESFEVYSPKMLVNIEGLWSVLGSRCLDIIMQRGSNGEVTGREVIIDYPIWQQTRDMIYPFLLKNWKTVKQAYLELKNDTGLENRYWELWRPMVALAKFFDCTTLLKDIKDLAVEKGTESQRPYSEIYELVLVEVLLSIVDHDDYYTLAEIKHEMISQLEDNDHPSSRQIGNLLRRLGFTQSRRIGSGYQYFLKVSKVRAVAQSLGISVGSERSEHTAVQGFQMVHDLVETERGTCPQE